jgi:hypothetical protein
LPTTKRSTFSAFGVVERREVPSSSLFRLVPEHVDSRLILALTRSRETVLDALGEDDELCASSIEQWRAEARRLTQQPCRGARGEQRRGWVASRRSK